MNAPLTILVAAGCALAVTAGASLLGARPAEAQEPDARLAALVADLGERIEGLRADQARVEQQLAELRLQPAAGGERYAVGEIEAAIERYLAEHPVAAAIPQSSAPELAAGELKSVDLHTLIEALTAEDGDWMEREELWQKLRQEGRLDEVLAEFERLAALDPNNPDRQYHLGIAYIQKIQEVGASALAGKWASKADEQFDKALALDETHWSARYSKAIALSHWPAFTGKTAESTAQLEQLIQIQSKGPVEEHHVYAYLTLGNIYLAQGHEDLALKAWNDGLALFPDSEDLKAQIATLGK